MPRINRIALIVMVLSLIVTAARCGGDDASDEGMTEAEAAEAAEFYLSTSSTTTSEPGGVVGDTESGEPESPNTTAGAVPPPQEGEYWDDPIGDWVMLSGEDAPSGTVPAAWDIVGFQVNVGCSTIYLAGDATGIKSEMPIGAAQVIIRDADGDIQSTVIAQLNESGGFDQSTNGAPYPEEPVTTFNGDSIEFCLAWPEGLSDGSTVEGAVRGTKTDSIDDMGEDYSTAVPIP